MFEEEVDGEPQLFLASVLVETEPGRYEEVPISTESGSPEFHLPKYLNQLTFL